jgi:hypothetical protein
MTEPVPDQSKQFGNPPAKQLLIFKDGKWHDAATGQEIPKDQFPVVPVEGSGGEA